MKTPLVTDDILRKLVENTTSAPVAVLFLDGDPDRIWFVTQLFERVAAQFDDRAVFVRIHAMENPTLAACWMNAEGGTEVVVFRRGNPMARLHGEFTTLNLWKIVEAVIADGRRA